MLYPTIYRMLASHFVVKTNYNLKLLLVVTKDTIYSNTAVYGFPFVLTVHSFVSQVKSPTKCTVFFTLILSYPDMFRRSMTPSSGGMVQI
jgi:hypothetical protein